MLTSTVLSVDDSSDDLTLISLACSAVRVSFKLQTVLGGDMAMAYLEGTGEFADRSQFPFPGLVLLDLKMPGRSGFDVLEWARKHPELHLPPFVILTSSVHAEDQARAMELGAAHYLIKPVSYHELQALVKTIERLLSPEGAPDLSALQSTYDRVTSSEL